MPPMDRYLSAENMKQDDFGVPFTCKEGEFVYDAKTKHGVWATMSERTFLMYADGRLGTGFGQKYRRNAAGQLLKVEG